MTDYGRIPPGYAPDWMLIEGLRAYTFGPLTEQHHEDLAGQWRVATERTLANLWRRLRFYSADEAGALLLAERPDWSEVGPRLAGLRFIWDEPGPFGDRLFVSSWDAAECDFYEHDPEQISEDLQWFEEIGDAAHEGEQQKDRAVPRSRHKGGRPNSSRRWMEQFDKLYPAGKVRSVSWKAISREIGAVLDEEVNSESLQEAVRLRKKASERVLGRAEFMGFMGN